MDSAPPESCAVKGGRSVGLAEGPALRVARIPIKTFCRFVIIEILLRVYF